MEQNITQYKDGGVKGYEIELTSSFISTFKQAAKLSRVDIDITFEREEYGRTPDKPYATTIILKPKTKLDRTGNVRYAQFCKLTYDFWLMSLDPKPLTPLPILGLCFRAEESQYDKNQDSSGDCKRVVGKSR